MYSLRHLINTASEKPSERKLFVVRAARKVAALVGEPFGKMTGEQSAIRLPFLESLLRQLIQKRLPLLHDTFEKETAPQESHLRSRLSRPKSSKEQAILTKPGFPRPAWCSSFLP